MLCFFFRECLYIDFVSLFTNTRMQKLDWKVKLDLLESRGLKYKNLIPPQTTQFVRQMKIGWNLLFSWQKCKYAFQMKFHANVNRNVSFFKCIFFSNSPNVNKKLCNRFGERGERECKWSQHIYLHDLVAKQALV